MIREPYQSAVCEAERGRGHRERQGAPLVLDGRAERRRQLEGSEQCAAGQFLKDLFHDVDYCGIAVRNLYINSRDFERVVGFLETLYASSRLTLPLKGVLIIGY